MKKEHSGDRLRQVAQKLQMPAAELARRLDKGPQALNNWFNRGVPGKELVPTSIKLGIRLLWLSDGEGPMIDHTAPLSLGSNVNHGLQFNTAHQYPVISWVSAGAWEEAVEDFKGDLIATHYKGVGTCFWLQVKGDSMTAPYGPTFPEGGYVLVDTGTEIRPGKYVIAISDQDNEATFKKLVEDGGKQFLKPLNPTYPMTEVTASTRFIGTIKQYTVLLNYA